MENQNDPAADDNKTKSNFFETDDGVKLHYEEAGDPSTENVLILLPGWSQTSRLFMHQIEEFSATHRVIALDPRGHGLSEKPESGYRISRLAKDVKNLLEHLDEPHVDIIAHSVSCAVMFDYIELFGQKRLRSVVFVDLCSSYTKSPDWTDEECLKYGSVTTPDEARAFTSALAGPEGEALSPGFLRSMFTDKTSDEDLEFVVQENFKFPRALAGRMAWFAMSADYRDVFKKITVRSLCVGGQESMIPHQSMTWMASQIANAELKILPGNHFMFYEDPTPFNDAVNEFLKKSM